MTKDRIHRISGDTTWLWTLFSLMSIFTSDSVEPYGKLEFFWRMLARPINFIPGI